MTYVITAGCIDVMDRSCLEQCPVDCIKPGTRMLYIDPDVCIDCGACEPVCPQEAIAMDAMLPEELRGYADMNAAFFAAGAKADPPRGRRATAPRVSQRRPAPSAVSLRRLARVAAPLR